MAKDVTCVLLGRQVAYDIVGILKELFIKLSFRGRHHFKFAAKSIFKKFYFFYA